MPLTAAVAHAIAAEVRAARREICGVVVADDDGDQAWWPLPNLDARRDHFAVDAGQLAGVTAVAAARALRVVALVHSHATEPRFSGDDRVALATSPWPWMVVVVVAGGRLRVRVSSDDREYDLAA